MNHSLRSGKDYAVLKVHGLERRASDSTSGGPRFESCQRNNIDLHNPSMGARTGIHSRKQSFAMVNKGNNGASSALWYYKAFKILSMKINRYKNIFKREYTRFCSLKMITHTVSFTM